jgi:hypothetical protein
MARSLADGAALCRTVDGLARRAPTSLDCADRVAAALAERLAARRVGVWLLGEADDDADLADPRLRALVLGEIVTTRERAAEATLTAPVLVFGVPVGTVDVERSGVYDWTVRDLDAARDHARMIGVALEWLLAQRDEGGPPCRSTA